MQQLFIDDEDFRRRIERRSDALFAAFDLPARR
jgi:hypothetical protein